MPLLHPLRFDTADAFTAEEEAYRHIIHRIRMGKYRSGDRLIPEDIASEIGTSRMPVREAFRRLATEGLVNIRPNRGVVVRALTNVEMEEVFNMRAVLEGLAARASFDKIQPKHIAALEEMTVAMAQKEGDVQEWVSIHREFHEYLCALSDSPRLIKQISALHSAVEPHMRLWLVHANKPNKSGSAHAYIIDAIRTGSPEILEKVVRQHIERTIPSLRDLMAPGIQ